MKAERRDEKRQNQRQKKRLHSNRKALRQIEGFLLGWAVPKRRLRKQRRQTNQGFSETSADR